MEIQYESKVDITDEMEKIFCEWNIYAKHIGRPRPPPLAHEREKHPIANP